MAGTTVTPQSPTVFTSYKTLDNGDEYMRVSSAPILTGAAHECTEAYNVQSTTFGASSMCTLDVRSAPWHATNGTYPAGAGPVD